MDKKLRVTRSRLALAVFAALAAMPVFAQDTPPADENKDTTELGPVIVTGSRKPGLSPTETISPVDVYSGEQLEQQANGDLTDSLTKIMPALNTQRFPIADGTAFVRPVSLRNLAPDQTLVMVDGVRRHRSALVNLQLAPLGTVNQGAQAVDFSAIASNAIKRVEVLRDGAAVLYGSDAIAGVVNVILEDSPEGGKAGLQWGQYSEGDGDRLKIGAAAGFGFGNDGFVRLSAERDTSDLTDRGNPRPDAANIASIVGAENVPYNGFGQRWGDPDIDSNKVFINAGMTLSEDAELYGFTSYTENDTLSGFFYRAPVLPPQFGVNGRSTLIVDTNPHDFLPDAAPQSLVDSIIAQGLDPHDYLTEVGNTGNYVLLNPIASQFPGGYSPLFGASIKDHEVVLGVRGGEAGNLRWDVHGRWGRNSIKYVLEGSINPSLGRLSPTTFEPGTLTQREAEFGIDFIQSFDDSPLTLAYGAQWRNETYTIGQGDAGSIAVGPTAAFFGVGSDGFQGFFPDSAGEFDADSYSAYFDVETELTDRFSAAAAVRWEHAEGFDQALVYKLSGRFQFTDRFALRGTYNTGFRTPTPGQIHTLNVTTTANSSGQLIPSGTYPVDHPVALALGAVPLDTETSRNFTLGFVWDPLDNVSVTLDYYRLDVEDRIGLISKTVDAGTVALLAAQGYPNANLLLGSSANFFGNAFDSDISGWDFVVDTRHDLWGGALNIDFRHNYNRQEVSRVKPGTINAGRVYDLENQVPNNRSTLTFDWNRAHFDGVLRFNYYGGWETTGGLFGPGDASDAVSYGSNLLTDLELRWKFNDTFAVAVGGDNIFDVHPDKEKDGTLRFLGNEYAITSPFGFNGAFYYLRATAEW
jgi:iron complex outermembrane receptor protein